MYGYIYKFTNLVNGKIYIGKHKYSKPKLDKHYLTGGVLIRRAISKYGLENFLHELVCICGSLEELNNMEIYYIQFFDCMNPNGYNMTLGGDGISEPTHEIIEKNRLAHLGKKQTAESNLKRSETLTGRKHSKEWIDKIRQANLGQIIFQTTIEASIKRHKNTHWYNDGQTEFMLHDDEVPEGLVRGRIKNPFPNQRGIPKDRNIVEKVAQSMKGRKWYNDGNHEKMLQPSEVPEGYVLGRLSKVQ